MLSTTVVTQNSTAPALNTQELPSQPQAAAPRRRGGRVVVLRALQDLPENFEDILAIDKIEYAEQAIGLAALFNMALDLETGTFSSAKARELINTYNTDLPPNQSQYKLGVMQVLQTSLSQTNNVVSGMVDKVLAAIKDAIGVALGTTSAAQVSAAITDAFTDLKEQEGDAWIFWQKKTAQKTTYSYTILFAIQDASTGRFMLCLPMSMRIEVDLAFEKVLWITVQDKASYSVTIDAMKVAQVLIPSSDRESLVERAHLFARFTDTAYRLQVPNGATTNVVVRDWAGNIQYATAAHGNYHSAGNLVQLMAWPPVTNPAHQLQLGQSYIVSSTTDPARPLRYNGTVPTGNGPALWFVSM